VCAATERVCRSGRLEP